MIGEVAELLGKATDGRQLVDMVRRLKPDIVVADVSMPVMSGLEAMRQLKAEGVEARFIFLTVHAEADLAAEAMRAGAHGYVLKAAAGEELFEAIRAAIAGRVYLTPHITREVLLAISERAGDGIHHLTSRQREVLQLIARGKRMKEIAADLKLSIRTVEDHKSQLLDALGVKTTAELVKYAVRHGLVSD